MIKHTVVRYHDISCGHRVVGHEGKCRHLHGHNYRIHFHVEGDGLDQVGRVLDFGVVKSHLCEWLESNWDHKMLLWSQDPLFDNLYELDKSIVSVPFNPTAENMGEYLVSIVGPSALRGTGCKLVRVVIEETRKCSVTVEAE